LKDALECVYPFGLILESLVVAARTSSPSWLAISSFSGDVLAGQPPLAMGFSGVSSSRGRKG